MRYPSIVLTLALGALSTTASASPTKGTYTPMIKGTTAEVFQQSCSSPDHDKRLTKMYSDAALQVTAYGLAVSDDPHKRGQGVLDLKRDEHSISGWVDLHESGDLDAGHSGQLWEYVEVHDPDGTLHETITIGLAVKVRVEGTKDWTIFCGDALRGIAMRRDLPKH